MFENEIVQIVNVEFFLHERITKIETIITKNFSYKYRDIYI